MLPVRDGARTLGATLASVRRQSLDAFECLIVDDGSTDATRQVAVAVARDDKRFRVLARPPLGLVEALNHGVRHARAPFVARMDADDLMLKRRLELQLLELTQDPGLVGVGCHVRFFPRSLLTDGQRAYEHWLNSLGSTADVYRERFVECPLAHPTWFIKRPALEQFPYREHDAPEDYDLLLRLLGAGLRLGVVPRRLLLWRDHSERLSRVDTRYALGRFTWLKAWHLSESFLRGHRRYLLWGYGGTGKALCRELRHRGHEPSHIVELHPGRLGQIIQGARVVAPEVLSGLHGQPLVVSVAGMGARSEIRQALRQLRFEEGSDFVCAA